MKNGNQGFLDSDSLLDALASNEEVLGLEDEMDFRASQ